MSVGECDSNTSGKDGSGGCCEGYEFWQRSWGCGMTTEGMVGVDEGVVLGVNGCNS